MNKKLFNTDGSFKPTNIASEGYTSIEYLEEICEWTFYRKDINPTEKLNNILNVEKIITDVLSNNYGIKINYVPNWSEKMKKDYIF